MFCPSCGKEIPDHSTFCLVCGKGIHVVAKDGPSAQRSVPEAGKRSIVGPTIIVALIVCAVGFVLFMSRPATTREPVPPAVAYDPSRIPRPSQPVYVSKSEKLFSGQTMVRHGNMLSNRFKVDTSVMSDVQVVGRFRASGGGGNDIQAALMDEDNFENWKNGHQAQVLYSTDKTTVGDVDARITQSGTYFFCFSNRFSSFSDKDVFAEIEVRYKVRQ